MDCRARQVVGVLALVGSVFFGPPSIAGYYVTDKIIETGYSKDSIRRNFVEAYENGSVLTRTYLIRGLPGIEAALLFNAER
ncbi:MAG: hypothetical protein HYW25_04705 [Candidatus Aenigmarchaeota archaeon]|nr:hypothetical protein [Candidatus Aenigmarchaeota archaeon]